MKPSTRRYIYGIAAAAMPLLIGYGLVSEQDAAAWLGVAAAVLVPGLAFKNTPKE